MQETLLIHTVPFQASSLLVRNRFGTTKEHTFNSAKEETERIYGKSVGYRPVVVTMFFRDTTVVMFNYMPK